MTAARVWWIRILVLVAVVCVLGLAGPRAWRALGSQLSVPAEAGGGVVDVSRVGFRTIPDWAAGELLIALLQDLEPRLAGEADLLDAAAAERVSASLEASPWVRAVRLERAFPDRIRFKSTSLRTLRVRHLVKARPLRSLRARRAARTGRPR